MNSILISIFPSGDNSQKTSFISSKINKPIFFVLANDLTKLLIFTCLLL